MGHHGCFIFCKLEVALKIKCEICSEYCSKILLSIKDVTIEFFSSVDSIVLISKWGFDDSSLHSEYKQSF